MSGRHSGKRCCSVGTATCWWLRFSFMSLCCSHWYFISLALLDHTKDTLNSFYFLVMNLMPLGGHKAVLQGVEMTVLLKPVGRISLHPIKPYQKFLYFCSCIDSCHYSVREKITLNWFLPQVSEHGLLICYILPSINRGKAIYYSRK